MIKGAQKQMIVVRTADSRYFDEAYFVLRREVKPSRCAHNEMLLEANRILEENAPGTRIQRKKSLPRGILLFLLGLLCGLAAAVSLCILIF